MAEKYGCKHYIDDCKNLKYGDNYVVQINSLHKINLDYFDYVVLDEFESLFGDSFSEIYPKLGEFDMNDDFFWFDDYGKINSGNIDDAIDAKVDWYAIAEAILDGSLSKDIYAIVENI